MLTEKVIDIISKRYLEMKVIGKKPPSIKNELDIQVITASNEWNNISST